MHPSPSSRPRRDNALRAAMRCGSNACSAVCFGGLLLLILGPALLSADASAALAGGMKHGLAALAAALCVPLAEAGVVTAVFGGTLSSQRRQRHLAAAVAGLIAAFVIFRAVHLL